MTQIGSIAFGDIGHRTSGLPLVVIPQASGWNGLDLRPGSDNFSTRSLLDIGTIVVTAQVGVFPVMGRIVLRRLDGQQPVVLGVDYPDLRRLFRTVFLMVFAVTRLLEHTTWGYHHRLSLMNGSCVPQKPEAAWSDS